MIVERRSQIRKSYVNYAGTLATAGNMNFSAFSAAENKSERKSKKVVYQPAVNSNFNFSSAAEWDDESALETETMPSSAIYIYGLITTVAYFAIGCYMFA